MNTIKMLPALAMVALLTACSGGGGGGGGGGEPASTPDTGAPPVVTPDPDPDPVPPPSGGPDPDPDPDPLPPDPDPDPAPPLRTLSLSWDMPAARANGDPLNAGEIAGYQVYWSNNDTGDSDVVNINGANNRSVSIPNLVPGPYTIALTTVDTDGLISELSQPVNIQIN